jgi:hexosaminidase
VPWKFHSRNSDFEPSTANAQFIKSITLHQVGADPPDLYRALDGVDESYTLTITDSGVVTITGNTSIALSRGLVTFSQLFYQHSAGGVYTPYAPVSIQDAPKFAHRGLNMDLSRNFYPVKDIIKMIDSLAYNKFNRFHLHITDGQSWPLVIDSLPELAQKGAYRSDLVYSPAELSAIQLHGARQGVQVYLEIDMPGHTSSIAYAYPDLIASFNIQPNWSKYAAEPPTGTLKLNSSAVNNFIATLFGEILPRVKPYTGYWHSGGDEVNVNAYLNDETIKSNDSKVIQPYMQAFVDRNHNFIRQAGLTPVVWEEMLLQWNVTLGSDVVVQTWQSDDAVAQTVAKGHKALVGNYNYWVSLHLL